MNAREAREILKTSDPLTHGWDIADARVYLEAVKDERKRTEPVVEELEKLREVLLGSRFGQQDTFEDHYKRFCLWEKEREKALSSSAAVLEKYKKECLGE